MFFAPVAMKCETVTARSGCTQSTNQAARSSPVMRFASGMRFSIASSCALSESKASGAGVTMPVAESALISLRHDWRMCGSSRLWSLTSASKAFFPAWSCFSKASILERASEPMTRSRMMWKSLLCSDFMKSALVVLSILVPSFVNRCGDAWSKVCLPIVWMYVLVSSMNGTICFRCMSLLLSSLLACGAAASVSDVAVVALGIFVMERGVDADARVGGAGRGRGSRTRQQRSRFTASATT